MWSYQLQPLGMVLMQVSASHCSLLGFRMMFDAVSFLMLIILGG